MDFVTLWQHVVTTMQHSERKKWDMDNPYLERRYHQGKADALRIVSVMIQELPDITPEIRDEWVIPPRVGNVVGSMACPICHVGMDFVFQDANLQRYNCPEHGVWAYNWQGQWEN